MAKGKLASVRKLLGYNVETKIGFLMVICFLAVVLVELIGGYHILPYNPLIPFTGPPFSPPSSAHFFGTNNIGQDIFSQIIAGAPNDALISFFVVITALIFGGVLGAFAGLRKGIIDEALMRTTDTFFAIPAVVLAIAITMILGPSPADVMIALAVIWWPPYARLARSEALRISNMHFIESAKLSGLRTPKIVFRHILPIAITPLLVYATLDIGTVIIVYSGLAFLGLAVRPPYPDWGDMVARYQPYLIAAPWMPIIPAAIIVVVAAGFSLLGDGLRAALHTERGG